MGERGDVGRTNGIVARSERGGTQVASRVDRSNLPPPLEVRLGCATLVTLKIILYQYFRFVCIVPIPPPCQAECKTVWAYNYSVLTWAVPPQYYWFVAFHQTSFYSSNSNFSWRNFSAYHFL